MSKYKTLYDREQEEKKKRNYKKYTGDIHRGDIFYFDKGYTVGVEQQGGRPGIIVSNDACNNSSEFLLVCYLTTQPKTDLPTHVPIMCEQQSICLCEQIHTLSKEKMQKYYCSATPEEMEEIDKALMITLGVDINSLSLDDYNVLTDKINYLEKQKEILNESLEITKVKIDKLTEENKLLNKDLGDSVNKLDNDIIDIKSIPEYIRVCAERDVYMKLYYELLNRK